jgi:hypothetical protein
MKSGALILAAVSISGASPAHARWPTEDILFDCELSEAADPSLAPEAWTAGPGPIYRYGWLLAGPRPSSEDFTPHSVYGRGSFTVFRGWGALSTDMEWRPGARSMESEWPRRLDIGAATDGPADRGREYHMQLLHADQRRGRARVAVTHGPWSLDTDVVDGGYVGECRIVRGRRAIRSFERNFE